MRQGKEKTRADETGGMELATWLHVVAPVNRAPEILKSKAICQTAKLYDAVESLASMNPFRNHVRWLLIAWMFVISAVAYLDRVNISIAGGLIQDQFHLTQIQLGRVFAAFVWGYALTQAIGGRL